MLDGLLGGVAISRFPQGLDTPIAPLSGGERRRIALARTLLDNPELLLLDEPTNHLDVEGVDWLARHLAARRGTLLVVTHDRWFLDAVCTATWEVADGGVHQYEGGYAAYVLARAEREREAACARSAARGCCARSSPGCGAGRRRAPPSRASGSRPPKALIADEPEPRDRAELLRFASSRLGDRVLDAVGVSVAYDGAPVLRDATWRLGPGDRVALVGVNGSGKTTLIRLLSGELEPDAGEVERGATVRLALLSQDTAEVPGDLRVLEALEAVRGPRDAQRRPRDHRRAAVRPLRLPRREGAHARPRPLGRRAPPPAADAAADGRAERAAARRAHQRPRHRHADARWRTCSTAGPARSWSSATTATSSSGSATTSTP